MKIFLIGGTGLVGSYLLPKLVDQNHQVYALTRDESKKNIGLETRISIIPGRIEGHNF